MSAGSCILIDDDADDREIFALALKKAKAGYVCDMAKNGKDAIELIQNCDKVPGYIFVDLNMPLVSGRECIAAFKKMPRLKEVPIIVYSTSSHERDIDDVKKLGAAYYLVKPVKFTSLVSVLENILAGKDFPFLIDANN